MWHITANVQQAVCTYTLASKQSLLRHKETFGALTGYIERSIATNGLPQVVAGDTGVDALVWFAPASVHDAEEEEGAAGQQHAMRPGVIFVGLNALAVLVPLHAGDGSALSFAVESGGLPFGDDQIRGVLHNPRRAVLGPWPGP